MTCCATLFFVHRVHTLQSRASLTEQCADNDDCLSPPSSLQSQCVLHTGLMEHFLEALMTRNSPIESVKRCAQSYQIIYFSFTRKVRYVFYTKNDLFCPKRSNYLDEYINFLLSSPIVVFIWKSAIRMRFRVRTVVQFTIADIPHILNRS